MQLQTWTNRRHPLLAVQTKPSWESVTHYDHLWGNRYLYWTINSTPVYACPATWKPDIWRGFERWTNWQPSDFTLPLDNEHAGVCRRNHSTAHWFRYFTLSMTCHEPYKTVRFAIETRSPFPPKNKMHSILYAASFKEHLKMLCDAEYAESQDCSHNTAGVHILVAAQKCGQARNSQRLIKVDVRQSISHHS